LSLDCSEQRFTKYYDTFMPSLKQVLAEHPVENKDFRMLRGKTFECISIIGVAVGKQKFGPDALQVMEAMTIAQQHKLEDDDPQRSYMLQAWARICKCLGQDFVPFLDHVMPSLLEACASQAVRLADGGDDDTIQIDEEEEALAVDGAGRHVIIKTAMLEDQAMACQMMKCIVHDIREGCFRYIEPITKIMGPLAVPSGSLHEGIRQSAISCLPDLVLAAARGCSLQGSGEGSRAPVKQLLDYSLGQMLEAMKGEEDMEVLMTAVQATKMAIEHAAASANEGERVPTAVLNKAQLQQVRAL
jgi:hypothetical protein